jgi:hypothetical protein
MVASPFAFSRRKDGTRDRISDFLLMPNVTFPPHVVLFHFPLRSGSALASRNSVEMTAALSFLPLRGWRAFLLFVFCRVFVVGIPLTCIGTFIVFSSTVTSSLIRDLFIPPSLTLSYNPQRRNLRDQRREEKSSTRGKRKNMGSPVLPNQSRATPFPDPDKKSPPNSRLEIPERNTKTPPSNQEQAQGPCTVPVIQLPRRFLALPEGEKRTRRKRSELSSHEDRSCSSASCDSTPTPTPQPEPIVIEIPDIPLRPIPLHPRDPEPPAQTKSDDGTRSVPVLLDKGDGRRQADSPTATSEEDDTADKLLKLVASALQSDLQSTCRFLPLPMRANRRVKGVATIIIAHVPESTPLQEIFVGQLLFNFSLNSLCRMLQLLAGAKDPIVTRIKVGPKPTCAFVAVHQAFGAVLCSYSKRLLCDADGVWVADSDPVARAALEEECQRRAELKIPGLPSKPIVIEEIAPNSLGTRARGQGQDEPQPQPSRKSKATTPRPEFNQKGFLTRGPTVVALPQQQTTEQDWDLSDKMLHSMPPAFHTLPLHLPGIQIPTFFDPNRGIPPMTSQPTWGSIQIWGPPPFSVVVGGGATAGTKPKTISTSEGRSHGQNMRVTPPAPAPSSPSPQPQQFTSSYASFQSPSRKGFESLGYSAPTKPHNSARSSTAVPYVARLTTGQPSRALTSGYSAPLTSLSSTGYRGHHVPVTPFHTASAAIPPSSHLSDHPIKIMTTSLTDHFRIQNCSLGEEDVPHGIPLCNECSAPLSIQPSLHRRCLICQQDVDQDRKGYPSVVLACAACADSAICPRCAGPHMNHFRF